MINTIKMNFTKKKSKKLMLYTHTKFFKKFHLSHLVGALSIGFELEGNPFPHKTYFKGRSTTY